MSTSPLRSAMVPVTRRVRAYFAPMNRLTETPSLFDPGKSGLFLLDSPPAPWIDLGWIDNFQRFCGTFDRSATCWKPWGTGVAVSRSARCQSGVRFSRVGQAANGPRLRLGTHECACLRSECEPTAIGRNPAAGCGSHRRIQRQRNRIGCRRCQRIFARRHRGGRCRLSTANRICGHGNFRRVCQRSRRREP